MVKKNKGASAPVLVSPVLLAINAFGANGGYYAKSADLDALVAAGQVEKGPDGDNGTVAVRVTTAGAAAATANAGAAAPVAEAPKATPTFNVVMNVPVPESQRGGNKGKSVYPFDTMAVGASFFIPATEEMPDPAKSLASTASSATRRYDVEVTDNGAPVMETVKVRAKEAEGTPGQPDYVPAVLAHTTQKQKMAHTRVFVMRPIADGAPWGQPNVKGAGVFRTQ